MELDKMETLNLLEAVHQFLKEKNHEKALLYANKLLDKDPTNENAWLYLGIIYRRMGKLDDAIKYFETAADLNNSLIEAWGLLTITYMDMGKRNLAKITMDSAAELNPQDEKILFYRNNLIRVYEKFGPFF
ncbi:MAG: tetratricopeptide repeat protein [Candidatus Lokiarchaeota archaeon]|nr:tetratricopeptide repeat protein [Candidatus Lokiarchaeota archaeon]